MVPLSADQQLTLQRVIAPLAPFAHEPGADSFKDWVHRMVGEVTAWRRTPHVRDGVDILVQRMERDATFRAECFDLSRDTMGYCQDRAVAGYNQMQAALLGSRAAAGELSTAQLHDASIRLFNRHALEAFAWAHANRVRQSEENLPIALYLETHLRKRLALPPSADMGLAEYAGDRGKINCMVRRRAVAHVRALHSKAGIQGLPAFLAGQGSVEFTAWMDHLRSKFPADFEKLNQEVGDHLEARTRELGGTMEAREQAGVECKELWAQLSIGMVARLTPKALREASREPNAGADTGRNGLAKGPAAGLRNALLNFQSRRHRGA